MNSLYLNTTTVCSEALWTDQSLEENKLKEGRDKNVPFLYIVAVHGSKNCRGLCYFKFSDSPVVYREILYGEGY